MGINEDGEGKLILGFIVDNKKFKEFLKDINAKSCMKDDQCDCFNKCWKLPEEYNGLTITVYTSYSGESDSMYNPLTEDEIFIDLLGCRRGYTTLEMLKNMPDELVEKAKKLYFAIEHCEAPSEVRLFAGSLCKF
jgi:hypothetical protein